MLCAPTSMRINDQIILEEDYDESYQPTQEGMPRMSRIAAGVMCRNRRACLLSSGIANYAHFKKLFFSVQFVLAAEVFFINFITGNCDRIIIFT